MDTATLYMIVTLISGQHRTSTREFPSAAQCEQGASFFEWKNHLTPSRRFIASSTKGQLLEAPVLIFPMGATSRRLVRAPEVAAFKPEVQASPNHSLAVT